MEKFYLAASHNVVQLFQKEGIGFPITKKEMMDKVGESQIQVDFDKSIPFESFCQGIEIEKFENKAQFFCALIGSNCAF